MIWFIYLVQGYSHQVRDLMTPDLQFTKPNYSRHESDPDKGIHLPLLISRS